MNRWYNFVYDLILGETAMVVTGWASSWAFRSGLRTETRAFQVQAFWAFPLKDF